ncbi:WecB/TagA/CpsF family glycosyltransferase [Sphingobium sp. BS19]|uniref:WecB/TagA/CpsF family glycosyltransferase n=1 Tax=Sphingobium sp. BS19 TaxID=3018973 RepID=UPI0024909FF9|nr:WecB/TagA/CpsF family glycosyltransferase [Sphingobium sp. BS19]
MTIFNDGVGVDIASRYLYGRPFPENLNGTDLTPALLAALPSGTSVFLVGGRADVARAAAEKVSSTFSHIRVVGYHHGYFGSSEQHDVVQRIVETDARFVMVGMGQPRQEIWAASNANKLNMPILCIGAQIDRFAGLIPRAPLWMRQMKMEWLYRLLLEPRRLAGRYLWGNFIFLARVIFGQRNVRGEG